MKNPATACQILCYMTPVNTAVDPWLTLENAKSTMLLNSIDYLPVVYNEKPIGIISLNIISFISARVPEINVKTTEIKDVMDRKFKYSFINQSVAQIAKDLLDSKKEISVLLDTKGKVVGLFSPVNAYRILSNSEICPLMHHCPNHQKNHAHQQSERFLLQ